jgi:hypothetical protein
MISEVLADLENASKTFFVGDVVADEEGRSHWGGFTA